MASIAADGSRQPILPRWFWDELAAAAGWRRRPWPGPVPDGLPPAVVDGGYLVRPWPGPGGRDDPRGAWLLLPGGAPAAGPGGVPGRRGAAPDAAGGGWAGLDPAGGWPAWEALWRRAAREEGARLVTCLAWQPLGDLATHNGLLAAGFVPVDEPLVLWWIDGPGRGGWRAEPAARPVEPGRGALAGWRLPLLEPAGCPPVTASEAFWEAVERQVVRAGRGRVWLRGAAGVLALRDGPSGWVLPLLAPEPATRPSPAPGGGGRAQAWAAVVAAAVTDLIRAGCRRIAGITGPGAAGPGGGGPGGDGPGGDGLAGGPVRPPGGPGLAPASAVPGSVMPGLPETAATVRCLGPYDAWPAGQGLRTRALRRRRPRRL